LLVSLPVPPSLSQVTTKPSEPSGPTAGKDWSEVVYVFTWNSVPAGVPAASKRRPWMLALSVSVSAPP
jgi:hypothetical protein